MMQQKAVAVKKECQEKPAVVVKNVTKEFIIPHERKTTLFENLKGAFQHSTYEKFTALKDVSFTIERGESVGIIGDNGSGKSTLLKIISRILRPTSGSVEVNGRITPFLELGVGFQQDLTARENIEVYSTIMGMSEREIAKNIDGVLEFAGLTKFADTKLKNFSSGMQVRLAFATAIQKEPDILLIDEVLAVGDMDFQRRCFDIFQQYKDKKVTMIFVSHDLNSVRRFCDRTLLLKRGNVAAFGNTNEVIDRYIYGMNSGQQAAEEKPQDEDKWNVDSLEYVAKYRTLTGVRWGNKKIEVRDVKLLDKNGNEGESFISGDPMTISMEYVRNENVEKPIFGFDISDEKGDNCFGTNTIIKGKRIESLKESGKILINIEEIPLLRGKYYLSIAAQSEDCRVTYDWHNKKYVFYIVNSSNEEGSVRFKCDFTIDPPGD